MYERKSRLLMSLILFFSAMYTLSTSAADIEAGKTKAVLCFGCHGENGISVSPEIPNLAGQKPGYIAKAIHDFKTGARKNGMMSSVVPMIEESDIENLAAYFSSLK